MARSAGFYKALDTGATANPFRCIATISVAREAGRWQRAKPGATAMSERASDMTTSVPEAGTVSSDGEFRFSSELSLEAIRQLQDNFVRERNWQQYHTPRNVLLALVGEVGEAAELFQWKGEVPIGVPGWTAQERTNLEHELSDVLIYLVRLAQLCSVDLPRVVLEKIALNAVKYPKEKVYGSSKKYYEYKDDDVPCSSAAAATSGSTYCNGTPANGSNCAVPANESDAAASSGSAAATTATGGLGSQQQSPLNS